MTQERVTPDRVASYGRGGAGNIGKEDPAAHTTPKDLVTPTLKSEHYTTGRGGSGNMAKNDPNRPEIARARQDVEAPTHREPEGPHHYGRGGAANIATLTEEEKRAAHEHNQRKSEEVRREEGVAGKGLVDKGKEFLHKLGGKK
ncbi:hypothetical protein N0V90_003214 [Kalmusia sp. IMI 367209]|nr:hypothetical protein N0V90_003214 [Kalmusia sp. IMI 367209]